MATGIVLFFLGREVNFPPRRSVSIDGQFLIK